MELIEFSVQTERHDDARVVAVTGEVDMNTGPAVQRELLEAIEGGGTELVVDLTQATFIDSTFLGVVLDARERLNGCGGGLSVVCGDPNLAKIFAITGLDRLFPIHETLDDATQRWRAGRV